ncbi:pyrroline-5-carboxylate reductase [Batrachochytrium salamandrivorans]|nr:pyrroline-5-carboxylate reductase [Batrachochytrium salamandrivorans]
MAFAVLKSVSKRNYWVDSEALLDVVTGVSGSGPAYFFLLVECLEAAGVKLGLPVDVARGLAVQTCLGAGRMLDSTGEDPAELRRKVTSPNGTTEAALKSLEGSGIRAIFAEAVQRATERSAELGNLLGKQ